MTRTLQTIKRRYEIVGEWRLSILKHHSQPTNHVMVRWHELFFLAFVMIWVICLISFALKTFRNQGKWFLRAVGPWRPFLAIEISRWRISGCQSCAQLQNRFRRRYRCIYGPHALHRNCHWRRRDRNRALASRSRQVQRLWQFKSKPVSHQTMKRLKTFLSKTKWTENS